MNEPVDFEAEWARDYWTALQCGKDVPDEPVDLLARFIRRPEWMEQAACRGEDVAQFFPPRGASTRGVAALCASCPVRPECLEFALAEGVKGWWAGTSERARERRMRPERRDVA